MTDSTPTRRAPGVLLAVLMAAMAGGPIFNYGIGALSAKIVDTYGITEGQYGFIITAVFVMAGLTAPFLGVLADRLNTRLQLSLIFGGVLVAFLLSATWQSYAMLLIAALIAGVAQSFSNPVTNRIIAQRVPLAQRSTWMGWKQSGVQVGLLVSGLTFPLIGASFGWRGAALFGAALCAPALVLGWLVITRLQRRAGRAPSSAAPPPTPTPAPTTTPHPTSSARSAGADARKAKIPLAVWLFALTSFLNAVGTQGVNVYASLFAVRAMGYTITVAGLLLGVIGVIGILSRIGWGRVTGRLGRPAPLIQVMTLGGIVGLVLLILAETLQQHWLMWVGVAVHAALPLAANVVINSGIVSAISRDRIGVASGLVATGMYLGFALGPVIVGQLVDLTGGFTAGWFGVGVTYVLCFVVAVVLGRVQARDAGPSAAGPSPAGA
ncbi:MFS transporter [Kocuria marina]|uniref:MFS transporter n=1 Tax=Kocuria marina TaxID=223184 RepID=UPI00068A7D7B|nr:MFS transporter [Kocuria marina]